MGERSERPIFVVGYQRSGTTLLQSLLGAHPRIAAPPEVHFWFRIADLADHWGDLRDDDRARAVVRELLDLPLGMLDEAGFDEDRVFEAFLRTDRSYAALLGTLMADFAERHGKQRWSEKTPHQRPVRIWSLLPDAQVLHIVRDPRDVAVSEAAAVRSVPAWLAAERCSRFTANAIRDAESRPAGSYLRLRYEDLARDPEQVMRTALDFLGETYPPELVTATRHATPAISGERTPWQHEAAQPVRAPRAGWSSLSPRRRALVAAKTADIVDRLGYPNAPAGLVFLGEALMATTWPVRWREHRRAVRIARRARTPAQRHAEVRSFIAEQAHRWSG